MNKSITLLLVYLQAEDCMGSPGKSYLVKWDLDTMQQTLILEAENPPLAGLDWETAGQLTLWDAESNQWQYDLATGEFTPLE
jgi:hypothetical protein